MTRGGRYMQAWPRGVGRPPDRAAQMTFDARLDGALMVQHRGEYVCCMLCLRQFASEYKVRKHLAKSALHAGNLEAALAAGRVQQPPRGEA